VEITLEKIEIVKDRTGVSYREAKEALEAANGSEIDAIVAIEDTVNQSSYAKLTENGAKIVEKVKEYIKKGNIARLIVKKNGEVALNIPVNAVIVGTVLAPWLTAIGMFVGLGIRCDVELVKTDGTIIDVSGKAFETAETVKEKGTEVFDAARAKAFTAVDKAKDARDNVLADASEIKGVASEIKDVVKDAASEIKEVVKREQD